ncbi:MAG: 4-phosphopantetheinyl transferase family protein, partial [Selenomonas sp.]|nr:4-phosphopantetheinyl transferase family protein [Selenomonas sp.]
EALTSQEYAWMLQGEDETARQERFYRLWTRKESLVKCEGCGFALAPGKICTMPVAETQLTNYLGKTYGIGSLNLGGYMLSAALQGEQPRLRRRDLSWKEITGDICLPR